MDNPGRNSRVAARHPHTLRAAARHTGTCRVTLVAALFVLLAAAAAAQTVGALRQEGLDALADGDYYNAIEVFGAALGDNPNDLRSTLGLAEAYYWLAEYDQAEAIVSRALELARRSPEVLILSGRIAIGLGELDAAQARFNEARQIEPNNAEAEIGLAELALARGNNLDATRALERALRIHPDHEKALLSLVLIYEQAGDLEAARRYLDLAIDAHGNAVETHILASQFALRRGDTATAAAHARIAQALDAGNFTAGELRARIAFLDGRYDEAIVTAEELLRRERQDATMWYLRGQALAAVGRTADAMDSFRTALRYEPENEVLRLVAESFAVSEYSMDAPERAELAAYDAQRASRLAGSFLYSRALSAYQQALRLTPFDQDTRRAYAELHRTLGHPATYLQELKVIRDSGDPASDIERRISVYENYLAESVASQWNIDQFTLDRFQTTLGVYMSERVTSDLPGSETALLEQLVRNLKSRERLDVSSEDTPLDYHAAFASARSHGVDFFIITSFAAGERSFAVDVSVHVGRTGVSAGSFSVMRSGPDRVDAALDAAARRIDGLFPLRSAIVARRGDLVVIDAGLRDDVESGMELTLIAPESLIVDPGAMTFSFDADSVLGTVTINRTDDLISEGTVRVEGLVDAVDTGDIAVMPEAEAVEERPAGALYPLLYDRVRALR